LWLLFWRFGSDCIRIKSLDSCSTRFLDATQPSVAMMSPAANAGEFCSVNNSYMRGCSFDTMDQCKAMLSGRDGTCIRDPLLANENGAFASAQKPHPVKKLRDQ
jgi:Protein of unknown function (DUF3551)